ncbi:MAG: hypothetical protein QF704_08455, partial [Anaerolineales bacterium]|nr:hypothetical protein [Anaerolineales bacterium]
QDSIVTKEKGNVLKYVLKTTMVMKPIIHVSANQSVITITPGLFTAKNVLRTAQPPRYHSTRNSTTREIAKQSVPLATTGSMAKETA